MSKNTTGAPDPTSYLLGRGALYFSLLDATTRLPKGGFRLLGNAPNFTVTCASETLDHTSSLEGLAVVDASIVTSQTCNLGFSLEEINDENLARFFAGETASFTNNTVTGFAAYSMIPAGDLALGNWYNLKNSAGGRLYDVEAGNLTITTNAVAWVLGTDYALDGPMGRIFVYSSSAKAQTAITSSYSVMVTAAADSGAVNVDEVRALTKSSVEGAIQFISKNPRRSDREKEYMFHLVNLTADGDFGLITTDIAKMPFKGAAQKNTIASPSSPTCTIREPNVA